VDVTRAALEEANAQVAFESRDLQTQRWLSDPELLRGTREAQRLGNGNERT
jgi:hypothetical protein